VQFGLVVGVRLLEPAGQVLFSGALEPSLYGFQLTVFPDHFDRSQVLVIASEMLPLCQADVRHPPPENY
jgi:hypothetical protein